MASIRGQASRMQQAYLSRAMSPHDEDYHTGHSEFNPDDALHSTAQLDVQPKQWSSYRQTSGTRAAGEYEDSMSIEIGRGLKHHPQEVLEDSSHAVFTFGNDSQYELTGTPPVHNSLGAERKTSVTRRANESAKRSVSQTARVIPDLSDKIRLQTAMDAAQEWNDEEQATASLVAKNTRFGQAKPSQKHRSHAPLAHYQPSAAESFQLPDISGIEELVRGPLNKNRDTPLHTALNKGRSRLTPLPNARGPSRDAPPTDRLPVQSVPIPEDEKRIYSSLQHLRDRIAQLESEKSLAWSRLEQYENEVVELRSALAREEQLRRPDSALGSDEETAKDKWRMERTRLQATIRALKQQLGHGSRRTQNGADELKCVTVERDNLVTQLGVECFRLSKAEAELQTVRQDNVELSKEVQDARNELAIAREEIAVLKTGRRKPSSRIDLSNTVWPSRSKTRSQSAGMNMPATTRNVNATTKSKSKLASVPYTTSLDDEARQCIADTVQKQFDRLTRQLHSADARSGTSTANPRRSISQQNMFPEPLGEHTDRATFTDFENTNTRMATAQTARSQVHGEDDLTELTQNEPALAADLRAALEQLRRDSHSRRQSSAPAAANHAATIEDATASASGVTRKSSLRNANARRHSVQDLTDTTNKAARVVRVQSPPAHEQEFPASRPSTGDTGNRADGETSDFIIDDITFQRGPTATSNLNGISHDKDACTVCAGSQGKHIDVPLPEFVSVRTDLPADTTLRPSQAPYSALVTVLRQLEDERVHHHLSLHKVETEYHAHDPAVSARARLALSAKITQLRAECDRKEQQIYNLYDALEAHKGDTLAQPGQQPTRVAADLPEDAVDITLESIGMNRAELAGRIARSAPPTGLDGADDDGSDFGSVDLPDWDGLSEDGE